MSMQEYVLTQEQADEALAALPANEQEARAIAWAIANGWELRVVVGDEQESDNAA